MTELISIGGALAVALIGAGWVKTRVDRRLTEAQVRKTAAETDSVEVSYLRAEMSALRDDLREIRAELAEVQEMLIEYRKGVRILVRQLEENGISPRWHPPLQEV